MRVHSAARRDRHTALAIATASTAPCTPAAIVSVTVHTIASTTSSTSFATPESITAT